MSPPVDPIFAAIERHKAAFASLCIACSATDNVAAEQRGSSVSQEDEDNYEAALKIESEAHEEFLATVPVTIVGVRAALEYLIEVERVCVSENGSFAATLLKSPLFAA